jgi:hypothetical protein
MPAWVLTGPDELPADAYGRGSDPGPVINDWTLEQGSGIKPAAVHQLCWSLSAASTRATSRPTSSPKPSAWRPSSRTLTLPGMRTRSPGGSTRSAPRSSAPTPTTTGRSSRSGWPSRRRCRCHQGGCGHRGGAQGAQAPQRGRRAQRQGGRRGGHRRRWWRRAAAKGAGLFEGPTDSISGLDGDEATGANIVNVGLEAPLQQIASTPGLEGGVVAEKVRGPTPGEGLDAATSSFYSRTR